MEVEKRGVAEEAILDLIEAPTCTIGGIGNVKG